GEGRRDSVRHAARDGAPGRGRARAAREGDRGRRRVSGIRTTEGRGALDREASDRAAAALPADVARARRVAVDHDRLPGPDRPAVAAPREEQLGLLRPDLRVDPLSGRPVALAPARPGRPGAEQPALGPPTEEELESCPFCEGRENRTPPEVLALAPGEREPDTPGWSVRVVPNKYPAFERQEVVVHSPQHRRSIAELGAEQLELVAEAWRLRAAAAESQGKTMFACVNEGRAAGASLLHSHSQLVWLDGGAR